MNVQDIKSQGLKHEFIIQIPASEIETRIHNKLQDMGHHAKIPGFRPGKIPLTVLKNRYGDNIQAETLNKLAQDSVIETLRNKKLKAAMAPKIDLSEYKQGSDVKCTVQVEVMPDIDSLEYKKMTLTRLVAEPSAKDVKAACERLSESFGTTEEIKEPRPIQAKDLLTVDMKIFVEDKDVPKNQLSDQLIELGKNHLPEEVEKSFLGKKVGETLTVQVTFPKNSDPVYAGKKGHYEISLKKIHKKTPAQLDDTFAEKAGYKNFQEFEASIKNQILKSYEEDAYKHMKRQVLDELTQLAKFQVPEGLVKVEFQSIWTDLQKSWVENEAEKPDQKKQAELEKEYLNIAERRVRLGLLLGKIGEENKIKITEKMIHEEILRRSRQYPGQENEVVNYYLKSPEALNHLKAPIFEDLVIKHIIDRNKVTDKKVTGEELFSQAQKALEAHAD